MSETLVDELRQITSIVQQTDMWVNGQRATLRTSANRDAFGRVRGTLWEDGILSGESRLVQQLRGIWDADNSSWLESPLEILQTALYDEGLSPVFRYLARWIDRTFRDQQSFLGCELSQ